MSWSGPYLLDTDTVSFALRGEGRVRERLLETRPSAIAISAISMAELRYGAHKRRSRRLHDLLDTFVNPITVLPFDGSAADRFGALSAELERRGTVIGMVDTMIAAHALALDRTLVTHDQRHFERVEGLRWVDWF